MVLAVPSFAQTSLSVADVRQRAVEYNRSYLSAREDVRIARTEISRAFADVLPSLSLSSSYNRSFKIPTIYFTQRMDSVSQTVALQTGFKNSFDVGLMLEQPIWHGGKTIAAYRIAKLYRDYSEAIAGQVEAEVVLAADQLFNAAILARSTLSVWQNALETNTANLDVVEKKFSQGMVSEYEVLRARVEKQNILPELLNAESDVRLSEKRLKSFIGMDLGAPIELVESRTDTSLTAMPGLRDCIDSALANRPEVVQAEKLTRITDKAIGVAKAEYWPELNAVARYDWSAASDDFALKENNSKSWTAGLVLSFNVFDGGKRRSDVTMRRAEKRQSDLHFAQVTDDITLEVEEAYDRMMQAKKSLDIQGATIASAEEGLKIARVRYDSGIGTQLEVLSAQTALTEARQIQAQAMFAFRQARAGLKKATTIDFDAE
jgi:outer membrane protein TolC